MDENERLRQAAAIAVMEADGGCPACMSAGFETLARLLPEIDWLDVARKTGRDLDDYDESLITESITKGRVAHGG